MKKIIVCFLLITILSNCEIKLKEVKAQSNNFHNRYTYVEEIHDEMKFGVWYVSDGTSQTGYATSVVNLTKEKLEVELLKKQLKK
jgi:hypothetical protein